MSITSPLDQVRELVKKAKPFTIIRGGNEYAYFSIQPSQEQIVFQQIIKKKKLNIVAVYNYRDMIIGYLIEFNEKAFLDISQTGEGLAIFFGKEESTKKPKMIFSDQKLRVLEFDPKSFFVSVKWRSNLVTEEV